MPDEREHDEMEDGRHTIGENSPEPDSDDLEWDGDDFDPTYDSDAGWDNEIDQGRWDDDPSPYDGNYSEE